MTESSHMCHVMTDNEYIVKLIETVEMMTTVNKKQQQFMMTLIYMTAL